MVWERVRFKSGKREFKQSGQIFIALRFVKTVIVIYLLFKTVTGQVYQKAGQEPPLQAGFHLLQK